MFKWSALVALLASTAFASQAAVPQVKVENGLVAGKQDGSVLAYLGIPYAAPPVGENRWRAPQPAADWSSVRDATKYGNSCMQTPMGPMRGFGTPGGRGPGGLGGGANRGGSGTATGASPIPSQSFSEDCLFANVWTPSVAPGTRLPVLVFFHGGGWNSGSGAGDTYAGTHMATHGIVMVTVNFRLGLFGFLATRQLLDEEGDTGNYGLMDQVAVLQWVKRNIAAFGGNPDEITIAGQSSGAASVRDMARVPAAAGLFERGIAESTPFFGGGPLPLSEALQRGAAFMQLAHAATMAELRAMPAKQLQALVPPGLPRNNKIGFLPVSGDKFFPADSKEREDLPMMDGSNTHENGMNPVDWTVDTEAGLQDMLKRHFGDYAARFAPFYQPSLYGGSINAAAHAILADGPAAEVALVQRSRGPNAAPVYTYLWTHAQPGQEGAVHGSEMAYVYESLNTNQRPFTAQDFAISKKINAYWVNFIKTGNPNGPGLPNWPEARSGETMELGDHFVARLYLTPEKLETYKDFAAHGGQFGLP